MVLNIRFAMRDDTTFFVNETRSLPADQGMREATNTRGVVTNSAYAFRVHSTNSGPLNMGGLGQSIGPSDAFVDASFRRALQSPSRIFSRTLKQLLDTGSHEVATIQPITESGLLRIVGRETKNNSTPIGDFTLVIDPTQSYAIHRCDFHLKGTINEPASFQMDYDGLIDGFPKLKTSTMTIGGSHSKEVPSKEFTRVETFTLTRLERCRRPASEFRLSHYGWPEPGQRAAGVDGLMVFRNVLLGGSLLTLVILSVCAWRQRGATT